MKRPRRRPHAMLVAAAIAGPLAISACGSTVAVNRTGGVGGQSGGNLSLATPGTGAVTGGATPPGPSAGAGPVGPGALPGPGASNGGVGAGSVPGGGSSSGGVRPGPVGGGAVNAPGVTAKEIYVGVTYETNGDTANAALGATGISQGNTQADAKAVIDEINAHGGVAGRKLVPVWYGYDATSTDTYAHMDQQACAAFTQDHHVFAVMGKGLTDTALQCMKNAGAIVINSGTIVDYDNATFRRFPDFIEAGTLSQDRLDAEEVRSLLRQSYFTGWNTALGSASSATPVKVGVLTYGDPDTTDPLQHVLLPALAQAGHPVDPRDVVLVDRPGRTSDETQIVTEVNNAELRFNQDRVTHVIILDQNAVLMLFFAQAAYSQHYYPRFAANSALGMQAFAPNGEVRPGQLKGAVGFGWLPSLDLPAADGDKYATAATKRCLDVIKRRTGQTFTSTNAASIALSYCDEGFLLADAINRAGGVVTEQSVLAALGGLHGSFASAGLPATYFSPTQHDGVSFGWDMYWDPSCGSNGCARYRNPHRIP